MDTRRGMLGTQDTPNRLIICGIVLAMASLSCQDAHFADTTQAPVLFGGSKFVQEGVVTIKDLEDATVVYPKPFAGRPILTFKIDQVWYKQVPYARENFRITKNEAYYFKIDNNHPEKFDGAWAVIRWKAEGTRLANKPVASRTHREDIVAMVERLRGRITEDPRSIERVIIGIDLHKTRVTDTDLELLQGQMRLQKLNLHGTSISDAGLTHLTSLKGLIVLQLNSTNVSDAGLVYLKSLSNLAELGLYQTRITDQGLEHLKGLPNLHKLVVSGPAITDMGLRQLEKTRSLRELVLYKTSVTAAGVRELQQALPQIQIVR